MPPATIVHNGLTTELSSASFDCLLSLLAMMQTGAFHFVECVDDIVFYVNRIAHDTAVTAAKIDQLSELLEVYVLPPLLAHVRRQYPNARTSDPIDMVFRDTTFPRDLLHDFAMVQIVEDMWVGVRTAEDLCSLRASAPYRWNNAFDLMFGLQPPNSILHDRECLYGGDVSTIFRRTVERIVRQVGPLPLLYGGLVRSKARQVEMHHRLDAVLAAVKTVYPDPSQLVPWTLKALLILLPLDGTSAGLDTCNAVRDLCPDTASDEAAPAATLARTSLLRSDAASYAYRLLERVYATAYAAPMPVETGRVVEAVLAMTHQCQALTDREVVAYVSYPAEMACA
jgi:hypothetical protein